DGDGTTAAATAPPSCSEPGLDPLLDQRPLELGEGAENVEQEFALRGGRVHLLGQRAESDAARLEIGHRGKKVRQRSAEPVQLPDDQAVASLDESQRLGETGMIAAAAGGPILKQVALVDPGGEKRVTLQVQNLSVTVRGHAHVTDQHVRKTSSNEFPHSHPFRQGLSSAFLSPRRAICGDEAGMSGITCFPTSSPISRLDPVHAIFGGVPRPPPRGVLDSSPYAYLEAVSLVLAVAARARSATAR